MVIQVKVVTRDKVIKVIKAIKNNGFFIFGSYLLAGAWCIQNFKVEINKDKIDYFNYNYSEFKRTMSDISTEELKSGMLEKINDPNSQTFMRNALANQSAWCVRTIEAWFHLKQVEFGEGIFENQLEETRNTEREVLALSGDTRRLPEIAEIKAKYQRLLEDSTATYLYDGLTSKIKLSSQNNLLKWAIITFIGIGTFLLTIGKLIEYSIRSHANVVESNRAVISEMNKLRQQLLRDNKKGKG